MHESSPKTCSSHRRLPALPRSLTRQLHRVELPVLILLGVAAAGVWCLRPWQRGHARDSRALDTAIIVAMRVAGDFSNP